MRHKFQNSVADHELQKSWSDPRDRFNVRNSPKNHIFLDFFLGILDKFYVKYEVKMYIKMMRNSDRRLKFFLSRNWKFPGPHN